MWFCGFRPARYCCDHTVSCRRLEEKDQKISGVVLLYHPASVVLIRLDQRKRRYLEGDGSEDAVIGRAMRWRRKAVTNYCRLRGGKGIGRWWNKKIGRGRMQNAQGAEKRRKRRSTLCSGVEISGG